MEKHIVRQDYDAYSEADHKTWATLIARRADVQNGIFCRQYLEGFDKLGLPENKIVNIEEASDRLKSISGWSLVPVTGLIPAKDFFYMILEKKYPVTIYIRKPWELDFSEQPDIFHDICGHLPLLTNEAFVRFLTNYSRIALKYINNNRAVELLSRLYWYTYEMGLLKDGDFYRAYGGAIITSSEEVVNINRREIPKYRYELDNVFKTPYNPYALQSEYFFINSFDDLFNSLENLEEQLIGQLLKAERDRVMRNYRLNPALGKGYDDVIGFLNGIQHKYPDSISFAAGQPDENYFDVPGNMAKFDVFVDHLERETKQNRKTVLNSIGQYNKTKGIVNDIVAKYLQTDENICADPNNILITVGAQEAFSIIVSTVCNREEDVILAEDPSYIGLSSFARSMHYTIAGVATDDEGIDLNKLRETIIATGRQGRRVKLLYVIPDYQNPSGSCMTIGNRLRLLEMADQYDFLIIEDGVYSCFNYDSARSRSLKSLDKDNRVIYVGSFSKLVFPGLRIGMVVADQEIENERGERVMLIDEMTKMKAVLTNNTSAIDQAITGGILLSENYTLANYNRKKIASYQAKMDQMLASLDMYIKQYEDSWSGGIEWNKPRGGFFIKVILPFPIGDGDVAECAQRFGVIFCPMRFFYLHGGGRNEIRLTFSNLSIEQIDKGVKQLAAWLKHKVISRETAANSITKKTEYHAVK